MHSTAHSAGVQLPQSGQTTVYSAADDGAIRAGRAWPDPRFSDNGNQTVTDNLTRLIWAGNGNLMKKRDPGFDQDGTTGDGAVSWQHALDYIHRLNMEKHLGYNDWRLPNLNELASLVNQGEKGASIWLNSQGFAGIQPLAYWTSSTNVMRTDTAWTVDMAGGPLNYLNKTGVGYVWPVRGKESASALPGVDLPKTGQVDCYDSGGATISCAGTGQDGELQMGAAWPQPRFTDNGDQTVTDNLNGLIWTSDANLILTRNFALTTDGTNSAGAVTWQTALDYVQKLNQDSYLGFSDWRLPNRLELASTMNYAESNPFAWLNWQGIYNVRNHYWTSASVASAVGYAWNVNTTGIILGEKKSGSGGGSFVWPVRGGFFPDATTSGSETGALQAKSAKSLESNNALAATASVALSVSTTAVASGYVGTAYSQTLAATGGTTPYTWSKSSGTLTAGLTLSSSGVISGTPTTAGTSSVTVKVKDASAATATKALSITINAALKVGTTTLANGYVGVAYSQTLAVTGGKTTYSWSVTSGALPAGLAISSAGVISGMPSVAVSSAFTVQVADANNVKATKSLTIVINPALTITTASLPDGYLSMAYSQTLVAAGGKTAYTWTKNSGTLPAGLILSTAGVISGTSTAAGTGSFTVQVKDANNSTATRAMTITVYALPSITTASLLAGNVGSFYNQILTTAGGKTPYVWSVTTGILPAGLSLAASTGVISGTPTTAGTSSITFQAKDANNRATTKALSITINAAPPVVSTSTLVDGYVGTPYSQTLAAIGGKTPYTWSKTTGTLPAGLSLSSAGVISGTPTTAGSSTFTVQVKDANNATFSKPLIINVYAALSISTASLPAGSVGIAYSQTLAASGGKSPYRWSITSGALPAGLTLDVAAGVVSGTPTTSATGSSITFQVKDANSVAAAKTLTLTIYTAPITITTSTMTDGYVGGFSYSQTLTATSGKAPYSWSKTSGTLPDGLIINSAGVVSGTPTTAGSNSFTAQVKDANNSTATRTLTITVYDYPTISTPSLPSGTVGTFYSNNITVAGGKPPFTFTLYNQPAGLTTDANTGTINGTPTTAGTNSSVLLYVTDSNGMQNSRSFSITIMPSLSVSTSILPGNYIGMAYSQNLAAIGGNPPYSWSVTSGSLPVGINLNASNGAIVGTLTTAGTYAFTVQAMDANNSTITKALSITVYPFANISGIVTDQTTGASLPGVNVTLALTGFTSKDPADRVFSCNGASLMPPDYDKISANDGVKYACVTNASDNTMLFKVRNPYGADSFTVHWNGIGSMKGTEYLAQSLTPTKSGNITKVSFYLPVFYSTYVQGEVHVLLKSKLGGDRGTFLAMSNQVSINPVSSGVPTWVDFTFPSPVSITAGQEYFLEINGTYFEWILGGGYRYDLLWSKSDAYPNGSAYQKNGGLWSKANGSLAFRTFIDDQPDIAAAPSSTTFTMYGGNDAGVIGVLYNPPTAGWIGGINFNTSFKDSDGNSAFGQKFNGDDITGENTVSEGLDNFYDQNGWLQVMIWSYSTWSDSLVTDQFSLTFNRTLTAVTDANGAYSFPSLPDGNYTATFEKTAYNTRTESGIVSPGQVINLTSSIARVLPASLQGTVTFSDGRTLAGITVTVTDLLGSRSAVSDSQGNYLVSGVIPGNYTVSFAGPGLLSQTKTGSLSQNQVGTVNTVMPPAPISLTITSPVGGALVVSSPLMVTGSVQNADSVTVTTTINGVVANYHADIVNGVFSASVPLAFGQVRIDVAANNRYNQTGAKNVTISFDPRGLLNGTVTDALTALPLSSVTVTVTDASSVVRTVSTGTDGRYSITGLSPGPASVTVSKDGYLPQTFSRTIGQGEAVSLDVALATFAVSFVGDTGNVAVMEFTGNYDAKSPDSTINDKPRQAIAKEYYKNHGEVDFLVFLSTFDYAMPEVGAQGFYLEVKNDIQGIGKLLFDNAVHFGSVGKLQGTIDLGNATTLAVNPYGAKLDATVTTLSHEMMHRFGAYVRFKNQDGTLNTALLGKDATHWSYLLDTQGSLMYGNGWQDNKNGNFTATAKTSAFSPLDLYLMGMIPKEKVSPMLLIDNPAVDKTQLPQLGATVTGTAKTVTIDDIIAAEGTRIPDVTTSQKKFNVGFVLLTRSGDSSTNATAAIEILRNSWAGRFAELTQGVGGVNGVAQSFFVIVDSPGDGATIIGPDVNVSGTIINTTGVETGVIVNGAPATVSGSRFTANHVPLQPGANRLTITATDANGLTAMVSRNVTSAAGNYLRIISNIESGIAPLNISLRLNGSFSIANPSLTIAGPVQVMLIPGTSLTEFTAQLTVEGTYTFTASVVGPDGQTYSDTVAVTVLSRQALETILKGKWEGMKNKVITGNAQSASSYFPLASRDMFLSIFNDANIDSISRLNDIKDVELYSISDNYAQGGLIRQDDDGEFSYPITFNKDEYGLWRIYNF